MSDTSIADYIIVGCGAVGMAFADALVRHSDATVIMIDQRHRPGGHWSDAYPFVRLHLPSHFYGVDSLELGDRSFVPDGHNKGLLQMASGAEVVAYYDRLMQRVLLASGRVTYLPMSEYHSDGTVTSLTTGERRRVVARKKLVDATYAMTPVPATHTRGYGVAEGVTCIPINELPRHTGPSGTYCVIGSGKTGIDACLWLLDNGIAADRIRWIMPRDAWWMNRVKLQFAEELFETSVGFMIDQMEAVAEATSVETLFAGFERRGIVYRLDPAITPTMYHSATINASELTALQRIKDVVRMGRVRSIAPDRMILEKGEVAAQKDRIYVDCSAIGLTARPAVPIFSDGRITCQLVRATRPCYSAAIVGYLEARIATDAEKNALAKPVPLPGVPDDWVRMTSITIDNQAKCAAYPELKAWLAASRLDPAAVLYSKAGDDPARQALVARARVAARAGVANLSKLHAALDV